MDTKLKKKWVAALRSGKFKQGSLALLAQGSYCCLGVLCRVSGMTPQAIKNLECEEGDTNGLLPKSLRKEFGITDRQQRALALMNDDGCSFDAIADRIEKKMWRQRT
jgi:hypothetical protein